MRCKVWKVPHERPFRPWTVPSGPGQFRLVDGTSASSFLRLFLGCRIESTCMHTFFPLPHPLNDQLSHNHLLPCLFNDHFGRSGEDLGKLMARDPVPPCSLVVTVKRQGLPVYSQWTRWKHFPKKTVWGLDGHISPSHFPRQLCILGITLNRSCICSTKMLCLSRNCISLLFLLADKNKMKQKKDISEVGGQHCFLCPRTSPFCF